MSTAENGVLRFKLS